MSTSLRFSCLDADDAHERRHPQAVMKALGITYEHATPQSVCDQWWFWNCTNVPESLPPYLSPLNITPRQAIGHGLSAETAEKLEKGQ